MTLSYTMFSLASVMSLEEIDKVIDKMSVEWNLHLDALLLLDGGGCYMRHHLSFRH